MKFLLVAVLVASLAATILAGACPGNIMPTPCISDHNGGWSEWRDFSSRCVDSACNWRATSNYGGISGGANDPTGRCGDRYNSMYLNEGGRVWTYVPTIVGMEYTFQFYLIGHKSVKGSVTAQFGSWTTKITPPWGSNRQWRNYAYTQTATSTSTLVRFYSVTATTMSGVCVVPNGPTPVPPTPEPTPDPATCQDACLRGAVGNIGSILDIQVTGVLSNQVWGSDPYSDDSVVGAAAVHAGKVAVGETKVVPIRAFGTMVTLVGSAANGVTSQDFGETLATFSFDLQGTTPQPDPPAPERCFHEPCALNKCAAQGTSFDIVVTGRTTGSVWGSGVFTDDSSVSAVAVHQGILAAGATGAVTVQCTGARASFSGSTANGVTTLDWPTVHGATFSLKAGPAGHEPPENSCDASCLERRCTPGSAVRVRVKGTTYGFLWGTGIYSDDTTVAAAAVHAGLLQNGEVGIVIATCTGPQVSFLGSTAHGITSKNYGAYDSSYSLAMAPSEPPTATICGGTCLNTICHVPGAMHTLEITGHTLGGVWGSGPYTADSDVPHAAVHAGVVAVGATATVTVVCKGPQSAFTGTTANGVTTEDWAAYYASFVFVV